MRKLQGRDYKEEISDAEKLLSEHKDAISLVEARQNKLACNLTAARTLGFEVSQKIENIPTEAIDIINVRSEIKKTKNQLISLSNNIIDDGNTLNTERERIKDISEFSDTLNHDSLSRSLINIENTEQELASFVSTLEIATEKKKLLEDIPCGSSYPTCRFIRDAHVAEATIPEVESKVKKLRDTLTDLNPETVRDLLSKYRRLEEKRLGAENLTKDLSLKIERNKSALERLKIKMEALNAKQVEYEENKEAIENLEKLLKEKEIYADQIKSLEEQVERVDKEKINLYKQLGSEEQRIENIKQQKIEFENIQSEYSAYDLFLRCMHPNGIAYDVIKQKLPVINEEINKILSNVVEFEIFFETSGNKFDIFIKHPKHEARPIEMASGAEKTMAAMAIRLALLSVSSLPKGDVFILDEPGTALDEENMAGFIRILELIKVYFKNVLLISHLDSLKDCVDMQIVIEKEAGFAKVNQ